MDATILLGSALTAVAVDQGCKLLADRRLADGRVQAIAGWGFRRVHNVRGGPLGLGGRAAVAVWFAVVACLALLILLRPSFPDAAASAVGLGLGLGGATSNLGDRLARGGVIDFIALGRWPVFNLADVALVGGAALVGWSLL